MEERRPNITIGNMGCNELRVRRTSFLHTSSRSGNNLTLNESRRGREVEQNAALTRGSLSETE